MNNWLFLFLIILPQYIQAQSQDSLIILNCIEEANMLEGIDWIQALDDCLDDSKKKLGEEHLLTALTLHKLGAAYYSIYNNTKKIEKGIFYGKQALAIREKKLDQEHPDIAQTHYNLGVSYYEIANNESALNHIKTAAEIWSNHSLYKIKSARALKWLGTVYGNLGEYENTELYYKKALGLFLENKNKNIEDIGLMYNDLGVFYHSLYLFEKAIESYEKTFDYYKKLPKGYEGHIAGCQANIAKSYHQLDDFSNAMKNHKLAIEFYRKENQQRHLAQVLNNLGVALNKKGDIEQAQKVLFECLKISLDSNYYSIAASACENLGDSYISSNKTNEALSYYNEAIQYTTFGNEIDDATLKATNIRSKKDLLIHLSSKAALLQRNKPLEALATYQTADHLLTLLKQDLQTQQSQLHWREKATPIYEQATAVAHQLYKTTNDRRYLEQMLQFSEKSKASILYDAVIEIQAKHHIIPSKYIEQEQQIKIKLGEYERKVVNHPNDSTALEHLIQYRQEHQAFVEMLEDSFPDYYKLKFQAAALDIKNTQQSLLKDEKTALLEYFVSDSLIYLFVLTQEDLDVHTFPKHIFYENKRVTLDTFITQFHQALSVEGKGDLYLNKAYALYQTWLAPALKKMPKTVNRLIIIPDDKFHYVPFESLLTAAPLEDTVLYKKLEYLLYDYQFTYAYSASLLQQVQHQTVKSKLPFLGFAPSFSNLVYNQHSVTNIKNMIGGKIYTDGGNNKDTLINWKDNVQVLHFGTHAAMNDEEPLNCQIWIDSLQSITTAEIYNLPVKTELVVLSACQTGIGQIRKGEGMMSLSRAFMYSGSPSVVASLWAVDDEKTEQLMDFFYENLKKGLDKDKALRQAKLDYLEVGINMEEEQDYFNPYYWSAFIITGNTAAIDFPLYEDLLFGWKTTYWMILMGMGFLIGCFFLAKWKRKSTSY